MIYVSHSILSYYLRKILTKIITLGKFICKFLYYEINTHQVAIGRKLCVVTCFENSSYV